MTLDEAIEQLGPERYAKIVAQTKAWAPFSEAQIDYVARLLIQPVRATDNTRAA